MTALVNLGLPLSAIERCIPKTGSGRDLPADARPPMTAEEKTIATRSKNPQSPTNDCSQEITARL